MQKKGWDNTFSELFFVRYVRGGITKNFKKLHIKNLSVIFVFWKKNQELQKKSWLFSAQYLIYERKIIRAFLHTKCELYKSVLLL